MALAALLGAPSLRAAEDEAAAGDRGDAYYHFALGHLYHQFAQQFMRTEYVERAVDEYLSAMEADPASLVIRIELINLYAGANRMDDAVGVAEDILDGDPENVEVRRLLGRVYRSYATKRQQGPDQELLRKAAEQIEQIAELEPENADNFFEIGTLYRSMERPESAERALRRALDLDPGHIEAQVNLAYLQLEAGEIEAAIATLEEVVESGSSEHRHIDALASAYEQTGRFRDAAAMLERLVSRGGSTQRVLRRLAENLFLSRQFERALELYQAMVKLDPDNADFHLRISAIAGQREDYEQAWEALERARALDPESTQVQLQAIGLLEAEGKIKDAVERTLEILDSTRKEEYGPQERRRRSVLLERLGALQRELDDTEAAIATFLQISELDPSTRSRVLAQIVQTWRSARDYERAEAEARKAVEEFGQDPILVNLLAETLSDRGKTDEAVEAVKRLLDDGPSDIDVWLTVARLYERGRRFEEATVAIVRAEAGEFAEAEPDRARVGVLWAYGSLHERAKQYDQAEARFRELLEIDPDNAGALNYLGYMFADRNLHLDEAHDLIQRALDIEPNNGAFLDSLGWVYYRQNKLDLAVKFLERSLKQYGDDPVVLSHLGDAYFKQGRIEAAKEHWRRGLEEWTLSPPADRDPEEMEALRQKLSDPKLSMADAPENSP